MPTRRRSVWSATTTPIIIDTPGFRSKATLACLGVTDFVLVPVKPSPFDVDRMLDTLNVLINGVSGRRPVFRCVLTQTTRDSVIAKHIRSELAEAGLPGARQRDDEPRRLSPRPRFGAQRRA